MATRFIEKGQDPPKATGGAFGLSENTDGALAINQTGTANVFTYIPALRFVDSTSDTTLTASQNGTVIVCTSTTSTVVTLPAAQPGLVFGICNAALTTTSTGHSLVPNAADTINFTGCAAGSSLDNTAASDVLGDLVIVMGGETANTWRIVSKIGTWAAA